MSEFHGNNPFKKISIISISKNLYDRIIKEQIEWVCDSTPKKVNDPLKLESIFNISGINFDINSNLDDDEIKINSEIVVWTREKGQKELKKG
jgi:hypothetical protein